MTKLLNAFSDAAVLERIERLDRAERDLNAAAMMRLMRAEGHGKPANGDALYELLVSAVNEVRAEMLRLEAILLRCNSTALREAA